MKRQGETRMLLFVMTGMAFLFVAAVVPLSGISLFLVAQVIAIVLGGITIVSLFKRYRGLDLFSAASIFFLYILMVSLFSPGVVQCPGCLPHEVADSQQPYRRQRSLQQTVYSQQYRFIRRPFVLCCRLWAADCQAICFSPIPFTRYPIPSFFDVSFTPD